MKYYIAYGSNLNVEQMKMRCPTAEVIGTAVIPGYELLFKGSRTGSYLTIEPRQDSMVPVGIWAVTEADEAALDVYEGYPEFYYKAEMPLCVRLDGSGQSKMLPCFAYIMRESRPLGIPRGRYMMTCIDGYRNFGFDQKFLWEARRKSMRRVTA